MLMAFFRVKLNAVDVAVGNGAAEISAVVAGRSHVTVVVTAHVVAMDKIETRLRCSGCKKRIPGGWQN